LGVACCALAACGGSAPPASQPTAQAKPEASAQQEPTLADAIEACKEVEASNDIPVGCAAKYVDGVPSMAVRFRNVEEARILVPAVESAVLAPFCKAAASSNRRAQVAEMIGGEQGRTLDCELGQWSDWQPLTDADPVASGLRLCEQITNSHALPMYCGADIVKGIPVLMFAFKREQDAEQYLPQVGPLIASPFCTGATQNGGVGAVYLRVGSRARVLDCSTGQWGNWANAPTPKANSGSSKVSSGASPTLTPVSAPGKWK
jgi:hypothetical protein